MTLEEKLNEFLQLNDEIKKNSKEIREKRKSLKQLEESIIELMDHKKMSEISFNGNNIFIASSLKTK